MKSFRLFASIGHSQQQMGSISIDFSISLPRSMQQWCNLGCSWLNNENGEVYSYVSDRDSKLPCEFWVILDSHL